MKAGQTNLDVDTRVKVVSISDNDPDEAIGTIGTVGAITHPFGDCPGSVAGLWVETRGNVPPGTTFADNRLGLHPGDRVQVIETGAIVRL